MNTANIELLGDIIHELGRMMELSPSKRSTCVALCIYMNWCNRRDITYSVSREEKITEICAGGCESRVLLLHSGRQQENQGKYFMNITSTDECQLGLANR